MSTRPRLEITRDHYKLFWRIKVTFPDGREALTTVVSDQKPTRQHPAVRQLLKP